MRWQAQFEQPSQQCAESGIDSPLATAIQIDRDSIPGHDRLADVLCLVQLLGLLFGDQSPHSNLESTASTGHLLDGARFDHLAIGDHRDLIDEILQFQQIMR